MMKQKVTRSISAFVIVLLASLPFLLTAQTTITQWTFEGDVITPSTGSGTATLIGGITSSYATGNGGGRALNTATYPAQSTNPATAGVQFMASTAGYENIIISWDHRASSTASRWAELYYTTDGTNWVSFGNNAGGLSPDSNFYPFEFDLSSIPGANDNPDFGVKIVSIFSPVAFAQNATLSYGPNEAYQRASAQSGPPGSGTGTGDYSPNGTLRYDNVTISGDEIVGATAVKLVILSVNGGNPPSVNTPFEVVVQAQDATDLPAGVSVNTTVTLTKATGSGTLSGTLVGTLNAGQHTITYSNVLYNTAQTGVSITASATAGMTLTPGTSDLFTVFDVASQLSINGFPEFGQFGVPVATFTIEALRPDNSVDENFDGTITLTKASGPGMLGGTLIRDAVAGIATFNDITFDTPGDYVLNADAAGLPQESSDVITILGEPAITEVIMPQYMMSNSPSNSRIPMAYRVTISGLIPDVTYKYINQVVVASDGPTTNGAGNMIIVTESGDFIRTTSPDFGTDGAHGTFDTDGTGSYTGWFVSEPTGNTRFSPGNEVFMRIRMNNGAGGNSIQNRLTTTSAVIPLGLGETNEATLATGIIGKAFGNATDFAFLYDNEEGSGRPLSGAFIEDDGTSGDTYYAPFYQTDVDGMDGAFGSIIPNILANGLRRVEVRDRASGSVNEAETQTSADGLWPYGVNTVDPVGGLNALLVTERPDFSADVTQIVPGGSVNFSTNAPFAPDTYAWEFIGGDPGVSSDPNPTVAYYNEGVWDVSLTLTNAFGSETILKTGYITVSDVPIANFSGTPLVIAPGAEVVFTDLSQGVIDSWEWTFEGGEPATFGGQTPPAIVYAEAGSFGVTLTVTNSEGSNTKTMEDYVHVGLAPVAEFDATFEIGEFEMVYTFQDLSENSPEVWTWTFDAGTPGTSVEQNPVVTYTEDGEYDVSLTVSNMFGEDTETKLGYVVVDLVGLNESSFVPVMSIAPNPSKGQVTINTNLEGSMLRVINTQGAVMLQTIVSSKQHRFDTGSWAAGLYIVEGMMPNGSKVVRTKLMVK
ncbi:MAG: PKD domain-containing protein [Bacteroidales bacterium]|nr:PKD domain-containing protein [Bacteroidales bacterium]